MREKAQMCYTDENVGKHMLITTVGINNQRERHMISTIKTIHLTDGVNLLEDGEGTYYISYQIHNKTNKKIVMGWSKTKPVPAQPMYIKGFEAGELDFETNEIKNPVARQLRLYIMDDEILHYGNVYIFDAIMLGDKVTAVINVEE